MFVMILILIHVKKLLAGKDVLIFGRRIQQVKRMRLDLHSYQKDPLFQKRLNLVVTKKLKENHKKNRCFIYAQLLHEIL